MGCDRSETAIRHVSCAAVRAGSDALPFADRAFDLVLCSSLLEHLPEAVFRGTVAELERVCAKYLVICVPYSEVLEEGITCCACCNRRYQISGHVRRFTKPADLIVWFPGFTTTFVGYDGAPGGRPPRWLVRLRRLVLSDGPSSEIAVCPFCGGKGQDPRTVEVGPGPGPVAPHVAAKAVLDVCEIRARNRASQIADQRPVSPEEAEQ